MADQCQATTAKGTQCQLPATRGDYCHLAAHQPDDYQKTQQWVPKTNQGNPCQRCKTRILDDGLGPCHQHEDQEPPTEGRPPKLTHDLKDKAVDIVARGDLIQDTWALLGVSERSWYRWKTRGMREAAEGRDTVYSQFWQGLERAERVSHARFHRMLRDSMINRSDILRDDNGKPVPVPVRIDPDTGDRIVGESVKTRALMDYLRRREGFREAWVEKHEIDHTGSIELAKRVDLDDDALDDPDVVDGLEKLLSAVKPVEDVDDLRE